jgi:deoxyribodipyrimidine photo-lyase
MGAYHERQRDLLRPANSGLSPWIHFGHLGTWEVLQAVFDAEGWTPAALGKVTGSRNGWWGLSAGAEGFLDELITWRELGQVWSYHCPEGDRYDVLQDWAQATLAEHAGDPRPAVYGLEEFAAARTHDTLWNACQVQLRTEGVIHNYLRMYWAKKILEWTESTEQALEFGIALNDKYSLDGRCPNGFVGVAWSVMGIHDRAWGPVRPVFGKVRYMNDAGCKRKFDVPGYIARCESLKG